MSSDKINLEEILKKELILIVFGGSPELTFNATIKAMKEACRQTLELAAENARGKILPMTKTGVLNYSEVDKQSILDTIKQIE